MSTKLPEYTITEGPRQLANGLVVYNFEAFGIPFTLWQDFGSGPDEDATTMFRINDRGQRSGRFVDADENAWMEAYPPKFPGIFTVEMVVQMLAFAKCHYDNGVKQGRCNQQQDIRTLLGIK